MDDTNRTSTHSSPGAYRFGLFTLNASAGSLTRNGLRVKLQDQPFQLLALLLERSGEIVTREEIRLRLWQSNTFVDFDKSLGVAVLKVREALGDDAANPRFLVSVEALSGRSHPGLNAASPDEHVAQPLATDSLAALPSSATATEVQNGKV